MWQKNLKTGDTIFALASGTLPSAVAIVKLSGPNAFSIAEKLFQSDPPLKKERGMYFGKIHTAEGKALDEILLLSFLNPHSHTGEDLIEFHCHGSVSVIQILEDSLLRLGGRPAERGEFTYRALLNGKVSPTEIEELGDVFLSQEPVDLERIYSRKEEGLSTQISFLRDRLLRLQAVLDTAVDFPEEYSTVVERSQALVSVLTHECSVITQRYKGFKQGRTVPRIVLAGRPNAGKSSLFNALVGRYRAIVHFEPGTTRDVIEEDVELGRRRWKLVDTAGVRAGTEMTERLGISLGEEYLTSASVWVLVVDGSQGISTEELGLLDKFGSKPHLIIWNKKDTDSWETPKQNLRGDWLGVSATTGEGISELWQKLEKLADKVAFDTGILPTAVQSERLEKVLDLFSEFKAEIEKNIPPEYLAERNREILQALEKVIGVVSTEDVLDRVFSEFCIGK